MLKDVYEFLVAVDSELSAIAHGRPPSDKETLIKLSYSARALYENKVLALFQTIDSAPRLSLIHI